MSDKKNHSKNNFFLFIAKIYSPCCFLSLCYASSLLAQTPLIMGTNANKSEYLAYINIHEEYKAYHQFEAEGLLPNEDQINSLYQYLGEAQESYLQNNIKLSQDHFQRVTNLAFITDWKNEHRIAIHYSFLRRAQLENSKQQQEHLITQAIEFEPQLKPDPKLFNRKFRNQFQEIKEKYLWIKWSPKTLFKKYDRIKINGRDLSPSRKEILLPLGPLRLSLFSNTFQRQIIKTTGQQLINWKPTHQTLSYGNCLKATSLHPLIPIFFSKGCIYTPTNELQTLPPIQMALKDIKDKTPPRSTPFLKNKWLWIGLGSITAFIASNQAKGMRRAPQQTKEKIHKQPTTHHGF